MLVLSRKRLEGIRIGDDIRITVIRFDRNQVRLGIEAPSDVVIIREELLDEDDHQAQIAWHRSDRESCESQRGDG